MIHILFYAWLLFHMPFEHGGAIQEGEEEFSRVSNLNNQFMTVFVKQPLALPESANNISMI